MREVMRVKLPGAPLNGNGPTTPREGTEAPTGGENLSLVGNTTERNVSGRDNFGVGGAANTVEVRPGEMVMLSQGASSTVDERPILPV